MDEMTQVRGPRTRDFSERLSINQLMLDGSSFEEDLATCRRVGATGIGIVEQKLGTGRDEELAELVAEAGLQATLCTSATPSILPVRLFGGPTDPQARTDALVASIKRFEPFGPSQFITLTGIDDARDADEQRRILIEGYKRASAAAAEVGALIGIEPIRSDLASEASVLSSLAETADLIASINTPNVGIVFDVFHHWDSETLLEDIATYASLFTIVQLGDVPHDRGSGMHRVIPGEGIIAFEQIFGALETAGYAGWYDLEMLSDPASPGAGQDLPHDEIARRAKRGLESAWHAGLLR
ncbi:sugar phosphate isomerase/epimerase family protein [Nocardioides sp. QY071]|uniref:sugar phosphate isomerase/epimerase family protein n=1 Tax=Nocardioides sp. QY071 TaxID=3044187 RepID=UPI00249CE91D|nr:sugar phosphate isomerase/epimerase family protein [Nocardioides sp. QY071]WGY00336.1 sugar phosphate isomerase/epimerase family protein [Nocardioides sp. QY071]